MDKAEKKALKAKKKALKTEMKMRKAELKAQKKSERMSQREKVEERREEVLANGRKYKYPMQFAKHRIVWLTVVITILALMALGGFGYAALYKFQSTDDIMYRITQVLPVSVATVDGENVRYSDYLMIYRSTIMPIEQQQGLGTEADSDSMRAYYKRQALTEAEDYTYGLKLGRELNLEVTEEEIDDAVLQHRMAGGIERSEETFKRILDDNFGMSLPEYRRMIYLSLMQQKVSEKIDDAAVLIANEVEEKIRAGKGLKAIAEEMGDKVMFEETGGLVDAMNIDGGRASKALTMQVGQTSEKFLSNSGSGYYFITVTGKGDNSVSYMSIQVPFTEFNTRMKKLRAEQKIDEKIELEEVKMDI